MYKLCILLPTINEDRCLNVIQQLSSFLSPDIKLFVYNQCFELPTFDNVINLYSEIGMGTMLSGHYCIKNAPESQYYYFIDDDFEFIFTAGSNYKMIGNAVPPLFSEKLALALIPLLNAL